METVIIMHQHLKSTQIPDRQTKLEVAFDIRRNATSPFTSNL